MHIEHFVLDGDCMGIQFPVTKSKQTGSGNDLILHIYDAPRKPFESVNLAFGIYFMSLQGGLRGLQ